MEINVTGQNFFRFFRYVYKKPVVECPRASFNKYFGLSLMEIKNRYGKDEAQMVYSMCVHCGIDLTAQKESLSTATDCSSLDWVELEIETEYLEDTNERRISVYLSPNFFTRTKEKKLILRVLIGEEAFLEEKNMVYSSILRNSLNILEIK